MLWLKQIFNGKEVWALIGVILGFALSELSQIVKEKYRRRRLQKALLDELDTNYHLIDQKKDILSQMISALERNEILSGESIHAATTVYNFYIATLYEFLKPTQRDNIHNIYERLKQIDSFMDDFESNIKKDIEVKIMKDPWKTYHTKLREILESCSVVQHLIEGYVAKTPVDVFYRHQKQMSRAAEAS